MTKKEEMAIRGVLHTVITAREVERGQFLHEHQQGGNPTYTAALDRLNAEFDVLEHLLDVMGRTELFKEIRLQAAKDALDVLATHLGITDVDEYIQ